MQVQVEKSKDIKKFEPIELTIKVKIEKGSELLELLEDEKLMGRNRLVCSEDNEVLSDTLSKVVSSFLKTVTDSVD